MKIKTLLLMFVVSSVINGMEEGQKEDDIAKQDYTIKYTHRVIVHTL